MSFCQTSCYTDWAESKTGVQLPRYTNGKVSASLYNPEKEADNFANLDVFRTAGFILIAGLGPVLHINALAEKYPHCCIAVVEANGASVDFIVKNPHVKINKNIEICTAENVHVFLAERYFPPEHGNFCLFPLRTWAEAQPELFAYIKNTVDTALHDIAADISTQAHFGKIWHTNILKNLQLYTELARDMRIDFSASTFPTEKTAFVAGAGPGLESCFDTLRQNRNSYYVIATDTAFPALNAQNIKADAVITIDPQLFSLRHLHTHIEKHTLFICDLCSSPVFARTAFLRGARILFFKSGHPLCTLAELWHHGSAAKKTQANLFPFFDSGAGTVASAALNFALKAGFNNISSGGTDFCYIHGKAYTKGSYFDRTFGMQNTRLRPLEHLFCTLMYAKELESVDPENPDKGFTTALLKSYRASFEKLCAENPHIIPFAQCVRAHTAREARQEKTETAFTYEGGASDFNFNDFLRFYKTELKKIDGSETDNRIFQSVKNSLLPYAAWYTRREGRFDLKKTAEEICIQIQKTSVQCCRKLL